MSLDEDRTVHHKSIYEFFKPTRAKIILPIIFLIIYFVFSVIGKLFGIDIGCLCMPSFSLDEPEPITISGVIKYIPIAIGGGYDCCPPDSRSYQLAMELVSIIEFLFIVLIFYLVSCIIVFLISKLKRKQKKDTANVAKSVADESHTSEQIK